MALRDVKEYYLNCLCQLVEAKDDLADFEQAVRDGYITEDRLAEVKEELNRLEENVNRLGYIMFLYELPKRKSKQHKFAKQQKNLLKAFTEVGADQEAVLAENTSLLKQLKQSLEELTK